jgi:ABC-type uncharacterized transport system permease subunit
MGPFDAALLAAAISITTPILLAATGELISEKAGVLNVGIEGMMLGGAFGSFYVVWLTGSPWVGVVAGMASGALFAVLMAAVAIEGKADQIVAGVGINLLAVGVTSFTYQEIFGSRAGERIPTIGDIDVPLLSDLGGLGRAVFSQDPIVYAAALILLGTVLLLNRTRWGLAIRAVGETPFAADTAGISVRRVRWFATLAAGTLAGLGGAYLAVVELGVFREEMTAGRGFLAISAVIFGRWHPSGMLGAACLFGGASALQFRLQAEESIPTEVWVLAALVAAGLLAHGLRRRGASLRTMPARSAGGAVIAAGACALAIATPSIDLPSQFWLALPFVLALAVLSGVGSSRMPRGLAIPYTRGEP